MTVFSPLSCSGLKFLPTKRTRICQIGSVLKGRLAVFDVPSSPFFRMMPFFSRFAGLIDVFLQLVLALRHRGVIALMFCPIHKFQIADLIVASIPVLVVYVKPVGNLAIHRFPYLSVQPDSSPLEVTAAEVIPFPLKLLHCLA